MSELNLRLQKGCFCNTASGASSETSAQVHFPALRGHEEQARDGLGLVLALTSKFSYRAYKIKALVCSFLVLATVA